MAAAFAPPSAPVKVCRLRRPCCCRGRSTPPTMWNSLWPDAWRLAPDASAQAQTAAQAARNDDDQDVVGCIVLFVAMFGGYVVGMGVAVSRLYETDRQRGRGVS
jgi:hypothetical protein